MERDHVTANENLRTTRGLGCHCLYRSGYSRGNWRCLLIGRCAARFRPRGEYFQRYPIIRDGRCDRDGWYLGVFQIPRFSELSNRT